MHVIRRRGWEIPEREATPEHIFLNRRAFLAGPAPPPCRCRRSLLRRSACPTCRTRARSLYPAKRNEKYVLDRPVTDEKINTNYNNFYEFGSTKQIARAAQALKLRPWQVKLDGMVEKEQVIDIDDLLKKVQARGAPLSHALRRGLVDVGAVVRLPDGEAGRDGAAAVVREIRADGNLPRPVDSAGAAAALASVALCEGPDHR